MTQHTTQFGYRRHPDQARAAANVAEHPVICGRCRSVGLSLAIDLAQRGAERWSGSTTRPDREVLAGDRPTDRHDHDHRVLGDIGGGRA